MEGLEAILHPEIEVSTIYLLELEITLPPSPTSLDPEPVSEFRRDQKSGVRSHRVSQINNLCERPQYYIESNRIIPSLGYLRGTTQYQIVNWRRGRLCFERLYPRESCSSSVILLPLLHDTTVGVPVSRPRLNNILMPTRYSRRISLSRCPSSGIHTLFWQGTAAPALSPIVPQTSPNPKGNYQLQAPSTIDRILRWRTRS